MGSYELTGTGLTLKFSEATQEDQKPSSFLVNDSYTFKTTAPTMTNGDVIAAVDKLKNFNQEYEFIHIVGESSLALWQAVSSAPVSYTHLDVYKRQSLTLASYSSARTTRLSARIRSQIQALFSRLQRTLRRASSTFLLQT